MVDSTNYYPLIAAFLTGIAGPLGLTYIKHKLRVKTRDIDKRKSDFVNSLHIQDIVNNSLNKLQIKYDIDRLWIAQFHNGGNFYPGNKSMKKLSMTFESTAPGIAADIMKMQNLPVSFFSSALQKLNNGEECLLIDTHTEEDYALASFWESKGVNSVYLFPVRCLEGGFIGILGVDFVKTDNILNESIYKKIKAEADSLSGYISTLSIDKE